MKETALASCGEQADKVWESKENWKTTICDLRLNHDNCHRDFYAAINAEVVKSKHEAFRNRLSSVLFQPNGYGGKTMR